MRKYEVKIISSRPNDLELTTRFSNGISAYDYGEDKCREYASAMDYAIYKQGIQNAKARYTVQSRMTVTDEIETLGGALIGFAEIYVEGNSELHETVTVKVITIED